MAGGDKAKLSGEYGEQIVERLLNLIGWDNPKKAIKMPCIYSEKHKADNASKSIQHGSDFLFQYKCPLRDGNRHDILISVKCRDKYPAKANTVVNKFKEFLVELAYAIECYPSSNEYKTKISGTRSKEVSGLIFWVDRARGDGKKYDSVIDKIGNFYLKEDCTYETVCLVDNRRAQFLYEVLTYVNNKYGKENVGFFYINTGLNNASLERLYKGKIMPYEYINAKVIPLIITNSNAETVFLAVDETFNQDYLKRLIGLAQELTSTLAAQVIIAFPDYNSFEHSNSVSEAKRAFQDSRFIDKVVITTYKPDFRDEE